MPIFKPGDPVPYSSTGDAGLTTTAVNTKSVIMDGVDEFIRCDMDQNVLNLDGAFSFGCWFKTTSAANMCLMSNIEQSAYLYSGWALRLEAGQLLFSIQFNFLGLNRIYLSSVPTSYDSGDWYHVAVTTGIVDDATYYTIFVNGSAISINTITDNLVTIPFGSYSSMAIGSYQPGGAYYWDGSIDEPFWYNIELTPTNVSQIYNGRNPKDLTEVQGDYLAYWLRCGDHLADSFPYLYSSRYGASEMLNMESGDIQTDAPAP